MKPLRVTNIQRGCVYDGPGVRTTVFLKGCSLHCPWCCNPETISFEEQWFIDDSKCILKQGIISKFCEQCERNLGNVSVHKCPFGVSEKTSVDFDVEDLYSEIIKDNYLYKETGGGVTFSGGEPLLYSDELIPLLKRLNSVGVNTTFESTLMVDEHKLRIVCPYVDNFIIDIKLQPEMYLYDNSYMQRIKSQLCIIKGRSIVYRLVFVDKVYEKKDDVIERILLLGIDNLEVLLCHNLGGKKYEKLSINNENYTADSNLANDFIRFLRQYITNTTLLSF